MDPSPNVANVGHKIAKGALWMVAARLAIRSVGLASTVILARLLRPEDFGLVSLSAALVAAVDVFGNLSFDIALIREVNAGRDHYDTVWTLSIGRAAVVAAIVAVLAWPAADFFHDGRMQPIVYALAFSLLIDGFQNVGVVDFRKHLNFHQEFTFQVVGKCASAITTVTLAILWRDYWALVCGMITGKVVGVILSYVMNLHRPRLSLKQWRSLINFSKWLLINNVVSFFSSKLDTFAIGRLVGTHAVGLYEIGYEIANLPTGELTWPIQRALFPGYAKLSGDRVQLARSYVKGLSVMLLIALPAAVGIVVVGKLIVDVFLGYKWADVTPLLQILSVAGAARIAVANTGSVLLALGKVRILTVFGVVSVLALTGPSIVIGALTGGTIGVAWAIVVTTLVGGAIMIAITLRNLALSPTAVIVEIWRTVASAGVMALAVVIAGIWWDRSGAVPVEAVELISLSIFGAVVYIVAHLTLWRLSGRPEGPERDVLNFVRPYLTRRRMGWARS